MKITAFTIVRNEEVLIAKHIMHLATLADEVLVIVQPSTDATRLFAKSCANTILSKAKLKVIEHEPDRPGWEFSIKKACEEASHDWMFGLAADETYCGIPLTQAVRHTKKNNFRAVAIKRLHAINADQKEWFKLEFAKPEVRLFNRLAKTTLGENAYGFPYELHRGLCHAFHGRAIVLPDAAGRIIEYKPSWQHYKGQLFCSDAKTFNEVDSCERVMSQRDLRLGRLMWERMSG